MSEVPSGMAFANPFSPLHQNLIQTMPNAAMLNPSPIPQSDQDNTLMRAHNLRAGKPGGGQMTPDDRSGGPASQSLRKLKAVAMSGMADEDQKKFQPLLDDPNISPQAIHTAMEMYYKTKSKAAPQLHNFGQDGGAGGQPQPNQGASIGGPTPANVPQGSMRITQGSGRDGRAVMSQDALQQWQQRAQQTAPQGEQVHQISGNYTPTLSKAGMDEWNRLNPGQPLPIRSTPVQNAGFQVNGIQAPPQQPDQQNGDPIVAMHQALVQAGVSPEGMAQWRAFAQAGATPEQLNQAAQHFMDERFRQQSQDRSDLRMQQEAQHRQQADQQSNRHSEFSENARVLDELQKQEKSLLEQNSELQNGGGAKDPNVEKDWLTLQGQIQSVRARMNQAVTPAQHQPDISQWRGNSYQLGQVIQTPQGPARVAGFGPDGHPLMSLSGR